MKISLYDKDKNFVYFSNSGVSSTTHKFTTDSTTYYVRITFAVSYGTTYNNDISINYPATDTTYHAYTGAAYPVTFPAEAGTVYGGYVDLVTGVLVAEWKYALLNDASKFSQPTANISYDYNFEDRKLTGTSYDFYCTSFPVSSKPSGTPYIRWSAATSTKLSIVVNNSELTLEGVKSMATDGKIAICYPLATPLTYQLTPQQITALVGANNIWSDANGDMTIKYLSKGA